MMLQKVGWAIVFLASAIGVTQTGPRACGDDLLPCIAVTEAAVPASAAKADAGKWAGSELFGEFFSKDLALAVPLIDVILLVIVVNVFALFKMARFILATSYFFCLKWVIFSNYSKIMLESVGASQVSMYVFLICGVSTAVLFFVDYFRRE